MPESWSLVIALLLAVLVGASLPVLLQLFLTLGTLRRTVQEVGPKVSTVLGQLEETTGRLNRATDGLDESVQRVRSLLDSAGDLGESVQKLSRSLQPAVMLGTTIGPAVAIAVKTLIDRYGERQEANPSSEPAESPDSPSEDKSAKETDDE